MTNATDLDALFGRKALLIVGNDTDELDLSDMHFKFRVKQSDQESPNTTEIRVYNLSDETLKRIQGEFTRVALQAGYERAGFGIIFDGTIKQFRRGKENATDTYLDILAAVGDIPYNFGVCNATLAAGSSAKERVEAIVGQMGLGVGDMPKIDTGGVLPRGKVLWGMGRSLLRCEAMTRGSTWSIQDGKVTMVPLDGYLPDEAVVLTALTGLIGNPEQTDQGLNVRCLLNPKLKIGGLIQIDNASINQTTQAISSVIEAGQQPYNKYAGVQMLANVSNDGFYRVYVVEYVGDSRGQDWYADIIGLAIDTSSGKVLAK